MKSNNLLLRQVIQKNVLQHAEKGAGDGIILWELMAKKIISIVGEGGFNSLYDRSVFLAQTTFPWFVVGSLSLQNEHRFAELKMRLEGQTPAQASAANDLLLITFTDLLASLIGEQLTVDILRSAWGDDGTGTVTDTIDAVGKEFNDE